MAAIPYYAFGEDAQDNVALSISSGPLKVTVEIMLLLHLVAAFPILLNPPAQYFENLMEIPLGKSSSDVLDCLSVCQTFVNMCLIFY